MAKTEKKIQKAVSKKSNPTSVALSKNILAKATAMAKSKASQPSSSSSESLSEDTSDSDDGDDKKMKSVPAKVSVEKKKTSDSEDDLSDASSSEESSKSEDKKDKNEREFAEKKKISDSENDASDASSSEESSESEDEKTENAKPSEPVQTVSAEVHKKRKADSEAAAQPKKTKLANGKTSTATSEEETRSIFVGRLSWNVDTDWLAQEFAECGEVESAHVQMDRNTGRSRGFGYVHFKSADAVEKALALNGKEIDGRPVNVDKSNPPDKSSSPPSAVLFVGNLSFGVDEDTLWETFGEHGDVKSVRVPTDRETGKPKGFAYVEFGEAEAAKKALNALQGFELDGRSIRLDFSQPRDGAGGRGGGQGGRGGRGRGGFGGDRGGFGGDRGGFGGNRGGFGGDRGRGGGSSWGGPSRGGPSRGGWGGRGGDRGGRARGRGARTGGITKFEGQKITFD